MVSKVRPAPATQCRPPPSMQRWGDITVRHNGLRDDCFFRCLGASLECEREVSGLLPSNPRRRPGDLVLRNCPGMGAVALDFAVTCPTQSTWQRDAAQRSLAAAMGYEAHKLADRETAQRCNVAGYRLVPMVAETLGGWGPEAQAFFRVLGKATAEHKGLDPSIATDQLYQGLGIRLQRANARAIMARVAVAPLDPTALAATSRSEAALVGSRVGPLHAA